MPLAAFKKKARRVSGITATDFPIAVRERRHLALPARPGSQMATWLFLLHLRCCAYGHNSSAIAAAKIGSFDTELVEHFWQSFAANSKCNLHVVLHHGRNAHHISECVFKAVARAVRMAVEKDPRSDAIPSTKGVL